MKKYSLRILVLALALSLVTGVATAQNLKDYEKKIFEYTLDNGLHLIILENHSAPVVSFATYVDVGAANEVVGKTGISHVLEHMAFKGTTHFGVTDYSKEKPLMDKIDKVYAEIEAEKRKHNPDKKKLASLEKKFKEIQAELDKLVVQAEFMEIVKQEGAEGINAGTGSDQTVYIMSLPSNKLELWMMMESERFKNPVIREYFKERDVIMEERRQRIESQPIGRLLEEFQGVAFKSHPYGVSIVGHMSDLEHLTRKDVQDYFKKYYVPSNMTLSIAGDVDHERVLELAKKYWGDMPKVDKPAAPVTVEPEQLGEKTVTIYEKTQPIVLLGYHKPSIKHPDGLKMEIISSLLGQGRTSRLYDKLVKKEKSAMMTFAFAEYPGSKYPGLAIIGAVPSKDHSAVEVRDQVLAEIEKLKKDGVTAAELAKVKAQQKAQLIRGLDSNLGMAMQLAVYEVQTGDWRNLFKRIDAIDKLTPEDIKETANKYLTKKNRNVAMIVTEDQEGAE